MISKQEFLNQYKMQEINIHDLYDTELPGLIEIESTDDELDQGIVIWRMERESAVRFIELYENKENFENAGFPRAQFYAVAKTGD